MASDGREIEIKLSVAGVREARRLLRAAGFDVSKPRVFEKNTVYDTAVSDLRQYARLLRVRITGKDYKLTYKGPPEPGKYKSREEIETLIGDASAFTAILQRLGYLPVFRYEKFRTEFKRLKSKGVATLDETPIGVYLELEGDPRWIDRTARMLGYEEDDYITASYARLFFEWRERTKSAAADMLFPLPVRRHKGARH
jgi:adenylate cyclase, class 2